MKRSLHRGIMSRVMKALHHLVRLICIKTAFKKVPYAVGLEHHYDSERGYSPKSIPKHSVAPYEAAVWCNMRSARPARSSLIMQDGHRSQGQMRLPPMAQIEMHV